MTETGSQNLFIANAEELNNQLSDKKLKQLIEATLFVAEKPMSVDELLNTTLSSQHVTRQKLKDILDKIKKDFSKKGVNLIEVASGFRFQAASEFSPFLSLLWQEKVPKYSRALLETLSLIAYRQPITRGEIEDVRGVAVSSNIIRTLQEREWVKVVGHKEVPGRPALLATTKIFLDYFGLKSLNELPPLEEIAFTDDLTAELPEEQRAILNQIEQQSVAATVEEYPMNDQQTATDEAVQHVETTADQES